MLYIVYCEDDMRVSEEIRARLREDHLAYIARHEHLILLGGAMLDDDGETRIGSSLILNVPDRATAEDFSAGEPFRRAGLYSRVAISRMRRAQWNPAIAPSTQDGH
ncbi:MAG: YciI family protein [Pseudomonadota bacterium]